MCNTKSNSHKFRKPEGNQKILVVVKNKNRKLTMLSLRKLRKNRSNEMGENKSMLKKRRKGKELSTTWKNSSLLSSKILKRSFRGS